MILPRIPEGEVSKQSLLLSDRIVCDGSDRGSSKISTNCPDPPPPKYLEKCPGSRPNTIITYTFYPQTIPASSMIMKPPTYVKNPDSSYYISVNMNCFTPSSYITTIRRDGWEGEVVGDFEMGISALRKPNTVCFRGYERPLTEMVESSSKMFRGASYLWKRHSAEEGPLDLYWEESSCSGASILLASPNTPWEREPSFLLFQQCFLGKEKMTTNSIARFLPASISRRPGRNKSDFTRLEVFPQGHDFLDDIVISVLIVERMRTSPSVLKDLPSSMLKDLF